MTDSNQPMSRFADATVEDIAENPHKYGVPTFAEFAANPEKYRVAKDQLFSAIDKGSDLLRKMVKKQRYEVAGKNCKTLEEAETVAMSAWGLRIDELEARPQVLKADAGKYEILVKFVPKANRTLI